MSINSKARRDARKKNEKRLQTGGMRWAPLVRPHAHLLDGQDNVIGGAGRRGSEWVMILDGREVARTDSPAMMLAMLKHAASLREQDGHQVQLNYSTELRDAATLEAEAEGKTLFEYLDMLEAERVERAEFKREEILKGPVH